MGAARFLPSATIEGQCCRCGLRGAHFSWADCIRELRDQIANLEIEIVKLQPATPKHAVLRKHSPLDVKSRK